MAACVRQPVVHLAGRQSAEPRTIASAAVKRWRRRPTRSPASSRGVLRKDPRTPDQLGLLRVPTPQIRGQGRADRRGGTPCAAPPTKPVGRDAQSYPLPRTTPPPSKAAIGP